MRFYRLIFFFFFFFFVIMFLFSFSGLFAQSYGPDDAFTGSSVISREKNVDKTKMSEIDDNLILKEKNSVTGVYDTIYDTKNDSKVYMLLFHVNHNPMRIAELMGAEFVASSKDGDGWSRYFVSVAQTTFGTIGSSSYIDDASKEMMFSIGTGCGYRFKLIQTVFDSERIFETVSAYITGNMLQESYNSVTYTGIGMKADYGIHVRESSAIHYGLKLSYNLATLKGAPPEGEGDPDLTISWMSLGLEMGIYF